MTLPHADRADAESAAFALELPSDLRLIDSAVQYLASRCRAFQLTGSRLTLNLRVGVAEALANAMIYGNQRDLAKRVRVEVEVDPESIRILVCDEGGGFDPRAVPDPTLPENLEQPGGRGIFLIRELMDEVVFNERGNAVRLVLYRDARRATGEGR